MTRIAVTGASGKLGGATLQFLIESGVPPRNLTAVVRDSAKASALAKLGIQVRRADYTDVTSLENAFRGIERLAFVSTSALGDERMRQHRNVVNAARTAGVGHIFYTSVIKPAAAAKFAASPGHFHTEALIRDSGIPHTFFGNNLYMDLVPLMFGGALATGKLAHNGGAGRIGFVARDDIAEALATSLSLDEQAGRSYALTAPTPYSLADVAAALGRASGKSITYDPLTSESFREMLAAIPLPPPVVDMSVALGEAIRAGEFDAGSDDVEQLMGRAPVTLDVFLKGALAK
jgi:NAD(P)H dehydrogenase (quinone)